VKHRPLKGKKLQISRILHSNKTRARETAKIIAATLEKTACLEECSNLAPNDPIKGLSSQLEVMVAEGETSSLMVVGHLPYLAYLAADLLSGDASDPRISFRTGTVACLVTEEGGDWRLDFLVSPGELA